MKKKNKIIATISTAAIAAILVGANIAASIFRGTITQFLCNTNQDFDSEQFKQVAAQSDALCQKIAEEGIALVKNANNCLPLQYSSGDEKRVNVFGWSSTDAGFLLRGIGSGSSTIQKDKTISLLQGLKNNGYTYNEDLINFYEDFNKDTFSFATGSNSRVPLIEPALSEYSDELLDNAFNFSDTAIVVISRVGGENIGEMPTQQKKYKYPTDSRRNYLEISTEEEELLEYVRENFDKTIVIINSANQMELGFLDEIGIDACLNVGLLGQSGANAIGKILDGTINPSGRLTDTYAYDYTKAPSYINYIRQGNHIQYAEDIYYGYKWYETAAEEKYINYDNEVQYSFGHGLSYTQFVWTLDSVNIPDGSQLKKDDKIELEFSCKNTGNVAGKDVMQVYYSAPYITGEIEKSSINLVEFAKTGLIPAQQSQTGIKISFSVSDMASFDCYDKNSNGYATYELDGSTEPYQIKFMETSHTAKEMSDSKDTLSYYINQDIIYDKDPVTNNTVETRFTGNNAYAGVPTDGSTVFNNISYLSRRDFAGTYPTLLATNNLNSANVSKANDYKNDSYNQTTMPTLKQNNGLYLFTNEDGSKASLSALQGSSKTIANEDLIKKIGHDYDSEELEKLISQMSEEEVCHLVEDGGFGTAAIESIGKRSTLDFDGPAGFNQNVTRPNDNTSGWTAFPCETLIAQTFDKFIAKQMGLEMGLEGKATGISGWYGPGINLHRSPFNARNYEYYSEDPVLSGYLAANVIEGAKANGLYAYVKHFTLSEPGQNARDLNTWITEQNLRENYLKPFEISVKKGGANAMMTAFNYVGGVWAGACKAQNVDILRGEWGFKGSLITDWSMGDGSMNTVKGVRAGNDLWLNPNDGSNQSKLNRRDPTDVYCARMSAKNIVYTFCNTYTYALEYDHSNDVNHVEIGDTVIKPPFEWWIPTLIALDVLAFGGLAVWMYFAWFRKEKVITEVESEKTKE